jgi:hypothetical protein
MALALLKEAGMLVVLDDRRQSEEHFEGSNRGDQRDFFSPVIPCTGTLKGRH